MTDGEALGELELAGMPGPDEVRAAYLRLLKVRKPDRDPDGFRRLRQAFELLKDGCRPAVRVIDPAAASQRAADDRESLLMQARRWLEAELAEIGPAAYRVHERLQAIDFVHGEFPTDAALTLRLLQELVAAEVFNDDARAVVSTYLSAEGHQRASEPVWRWLLEGHSELVSGYFLERAPQWLPLDLVLQTCRVICDDRREPFRAGQLLRRLFVNSEPAALRAHDVLASQLVLDIANGGFVDLACELAAELRAAVETPATLLVSQWALVRDALPADAHKQLAWAMAHRESRDVRASFDLSAAGVLRLHEVLPSRAPELWAWIQPVLPPPPALDPELPPLVARFWLNFEAAGRDHELADRFLREHGAEPEAELVWRRLVAERVESLSTTTLVEVPREVGVQTMLLACRALASRPKALEGAGLVLRRVLAEADASALAEHETMVARLVFKLGRAGFVDLAAELAQRLSALAQGPMAAAAGEWGRLRAALPLDVLLLLAGRAVNPDLAVELPPARLEALEQALTRAPALQHLLALPSRPLPPAVEPPVVPQRDVSWVILLLTLGVVALLLVLFSR